MNNQFLGKNVQLVGHFDSDVLTNSLSSVDWPFKEMILKQMLQMNEWAALFLSKPHESLGREGPVCPFVPLAIKKKLFLMTYFLCDANTTLDDVQYAMHQYRKYFQQTALSDSSYSTNALLIVFVHTDNQLQPLIELIEQSQQNLKPQFIKENTMIGQFFEGCDVAGIHNKSFKPFCSPVPSIAIRKLMPQDLVFITDTSENMQLYIDEFHIENRASLMKLLKSICLDKNQNVLSHADVLLTQLDRPLDRI